MHQSEFFIWKFVIVANNYIWTKLEIETTSMIVNMSLHLLVCIFSMIKLNRTFQMQINSIFQRLFGTLRQIRIERQKNLWAIFAIFNLTRHITSNLLYIDATEWNESINFPQKMSNTRTQVFNSIIIAVVLIDFIRTSFICQISLLFWLVNSLLTQSDISDFFYMNV